MGLFKSEDKKEKERLDKEQKMLEKYGVENLSDPADLASVKKIASELVGSGLVETGLKISMAKPDDALKISYLRSIMEQNFIVIRQLDKIAKLLEGK